MCHFLCMPQREGVGVGRGDLIADIWFPHFITLLWFDKLSMNVQLLG